MFFLMREALRLATVDFLLSEVALVTVECASVIVVDEGGGGVLGYWFGWWWSRGKKEAVDPSRSNYLAEESLRTGLCSVAS